MARRTFEGELGKLREEIRSMQFWFSQLDEDTKQDPGVQKAIQALMNTRMALSSIYFRAHGNELGPPRQEEAS